LTEELESRGTRKKIKKPMDAAVDLGDDREMEAITGSVNW
jgi:hypothetical protein